jgi:predicted GIY-YIG superfamily endonuclease
MFYCYLLYTDEGQTYIGATTDPYRRLRQHNKEIVGGARATGIQVNKGINWKIMCYISGIPEWRSALQIEWRWKQLCRTKFKSMRNSIERRLHALYTLLSLEKPTENSIPYEAYPDGLPSIIWISSEHNNLYNGLKNYYLELIK